MIVSLSTNHASDWEWQAVLGQMEELRRQNYITKLKQDPAGSTYWTITTKGENYLHALERAESLTAENTSDVDSGDISNRPTAKGLLHISSAIPSPDALLRLKPEEAACPLMNCLLSLSEEELNRHNFFISIYPTQGYPPDQHEKIKSKLAAAWNWRQAQGYLVPRPGNPNPDWVSITDDGRAWAKDDCDPSRMERLRAPKSARTSPIRKTTPDPPLTQSAAPAAAELAPSEGVELAIRALSDKPSDVDLLEFADYAQALNDFIENEKTQTPLTIGIDGAWGSGKTTLMRVIQERRTPKEKRETSRLQARSVWFNAWKYDLEESLWASLALEILSQVRRQCRWRERTSLWFRLNWKRFDKGKFGSDLLKFIVYPVALIIATALGTFIWNRWPYPNLDVAKLAKVAVGRGLITTFIDVLIKMHDVGIVHCEVVNAKF